MVLVIALVVLIILLYLIFIHGNKGSEFHENCEQLLRICNGNQAQAQRLLEYEKRQNPQLSDEEACRIAVISYKRDNR
ncbi:hypothetical protein BGP_4902 [Beggiatoa sp. PS]|nr:hypothetical protein BGP_4902 [Beggiatoa sp. PS]